MASQQQKRKYAQVMKTHPNVGSSGHSPYQLPRPSVRATPYRQQYAAKYAGLNRRGVASVDTGFVDLVSAGYNMDTTGQIVLLATIAQGASVNTRVGKKVILKSVQGRGYISGNATTLFSLCTFMIVYDRRPTGALPTIADILVSVDPRALNNDANSGRFKILKRCDEVIIGNVTNPDTGVEVKEAGFYVKLRGLPSVFKAAGTGAIGDIEEGALYLVTLGQVAAGTAACTLSMGFRTRFIDV